MTGIPAWQAPVAGQPALAGHVNQLLGAHAVTYVYSGAAQASAAAATGTVSGSGTYLAQSFTTGASQTTIGYLILSLSANGTPAPWPLSIQASSGGAPSGVPLVSTSLPVEFGLSPAVMMPVTGLSPGTEYWIVGAAQSSAGYFDWDQSAATSGASTSTNGTTWTAQAYGFSFEVFDGTPSMPLAGTWEDSGARWTSLSYSNGQVTSVSEYTAGQPGGYTASVRSLSYSGHAVTGAA